MMHTYHYTILAARLFVESTSLDTTETHNSMSRQHGSAASSIDCRGRLLEMGCHVLIWGASRG